MVVVMGRCNCPSSSRDCGLPKVHGPRRLRGSGTITALQQQGTVAAVCLRVCLGGRGPETAGLLLGPHLGVQPALG